MASCMAESNGNLINLNKLKSENDNKDTTDDKITLIDAK